MYFWNQERGDAELLAKFFEGKFLYDHIAKCWLIYSNGVWNQDQENQTLKTAIEKLSKVYSVSYTHLTLPTILLV